VYCAYVRIFFKNPFFKSISNIIEFLIEKGVSEKMLLDAFFDKSTRGQWELTDVDLLKLIFKKHPEQIKLLVTNPSGSYTDTYLDIISRRSKDFMEIIDFLNETSIVHRICQNLVYQRPTWS